MSQERTQLMNRIQKAMPIVDREALSRMTMEELENINRGYRLKDEADTPAWRPSDLQRTWCPLTCHTCNQSWNMPLYTKVATVVWCPHCSIQLKTMTEEEMG